MEDNQEEKEDKVAFKSEVLMENNEVETKTKTVRVSEESIDHLDAEKHFYCLQIKYEQGSKEDETIINRAAMMASKAMKEQTGCEKGMDRVILEGSYAIATAIASKNENFFAKALYCKYEKYPIGIMLGDYNSILNIAISPTLYIESKYRSKELINKLQDTFKYWAINTKKADKAFMEKLTEI